MNAATATLIVILATGLTLATIRQYEQLLRDERDRADRATEHAEQCQALLSQTRHPARTIEQGRRGLTTWQDIEREQLDTRLARHLHVAGDEAS